ncbi:MAG: hypothetical protein K6G55_08245 [Selenomonadaceae bacterium]|nr:hypothetical protein [Selenomonadaceae bacterium]
MRKFFAAMIVCTMIMFTGIGRAAAVDIDLTKMSSTMIYSTVFNIVTTPKNFVGKTMRMHGEYTIYPITDTETIHACLVRDAAGCCSQGIEFRLINGNYPSGTCDITVVGTLAIMNVDGKDVCYMINASLE